MFKESHKILYGCRPDFRLLVVWWIDARPDGLIIMPYVFFFYQMNVRVVM